MWRWIINDFEAGLPLLEAIRLRIPAAPAGFLHQLLRKGRIAYHGTTIGTDLPVASGAAIEIQSSARLDTLIAASGLPPMAVLYEDRHVLVVDKPAGLATHRAAEVTDHLQGRVGVFLRWRQAPYQAAPVHRLDIGTSGPVLFGKGRQATGAYGRLLAAGCFYKSYLALVTGVASPNGELDTPVRDGPRYKAALTRYRRLAVMSGHSLLELELLTGRTHQIRCQLAAAGWPILGDTRYGGQNRARLERPWLHCHRLAFPTLDSDARRQVTSPLPAELAETLAALGGTIPLEIISCGEIF